MAKKREDFATRFWVKVQKTDGCWLWTATRPGGRYGVFKVDRATRRGAHRVAYELSFGAVPLGLSVLHRCDNPGCVRPDHLFVGTTSDNAADMVAKGRSTRGRVRPGTGPTGVRNSHAVLTPAIVSEIRKLRLKRGATLRSLAAKFGVSKSQIGNIVSGGQWKGVR